MRAVIQRVSEAKVSVGGTTVGEIGPGLLVFLGVGNRDTETQASQLARKILNLRIFPGNDGRINRSVLDTGGSLLIVSQFTLYGDTRKGNRPSYSDAAPLETAKPLYDFFVETCRGLGINVQAGIFQAHMQVSLTNDGPVTLLFDSTA
jgi:D-tyrosyl-tRNA(Tyr) deacylase